MSKKQKMIFVGMNKMQEFVKEISVESKKTKKEIAEDIGLSREGLFHITNRSGKINSKNWELFKELYISILGRELVFEEENTKGNLLADYTLEELIIEIKKRGGTVTF